MNHDDKTMLALAALTYRGFGLHSEAEVDGKLRRWLPKLAQAGLGDWELVWGPATFRAASSLFDDAMVYIARQSEGGGYRYAVAIRGTNPVSVFDWVFGDFWVQLQIDQAPAVDPPARLSASSALGITILQRLAAEVPPSQSHGLAALAADLRTGLAGLSSQLTEITPARFFADPSGFTVSDLKARLAAITGPAGTTLLHGALDNLLTHLNPATATASLERGVYNQILRKITDASDAGQSLLAYLSGAVHAGDRVSVTGHSKGGALAITAALWLADALPAALRDRVECFSFAGPTPGNSVFAQRYNARLGERTRRIVNRRDIVPHAWALSELAMLPAVYPELAGPLSLVSTSVKNLDYAHVGGALIEIPLQNAIGGLPQRLIYQHLDAYLAAAGLADRGWTAQSIFLDS